MSTLFFRRLTTAVLPAAAALAGGCSAPNNIALSAHPLSRAAITQYADAHHIFAETLIKSGQGGSTLDAPREVAARLSAAVSAASRSPGETDTYSCPLFRSRLGEWYLLTAPTEASRAQRLFDESIDPNTGLEEWIPGYIGMAKWATMGISSDSSKAQLARHLLDVADEKLEALIEASRPRHGQPPMQPFGGLLALAQKGQEESENGSAKLGPQARVRLVWNWLLADEQWWEPTWYHPDAGSFTAGELTNRLERRLRARIAFQRAMISRMSNDPAAVVRARLENGQDGALDYDPDFWEAELEMVALLRQDGRFEDAKNRLEPLFRPTTSLLANNPRLRLELAQIYIDWFERDKTPAVADHAHANMNALLNQIAPTYADAWLAAARLQMLLARHAAWLDAAERLRQCDLTRDSLAQSRHYGADNRRAAELDRELESVAVRLAESGATE